MSDRTQNGSTPDGLLSYVPYLFCSSSYLSGMRSYTIIGRRTPCAAEANPAAVRMKIFAKNDVQAKSRFWYFMKRITKVKAARGEILSIEENIPTDTTTARNYRITLSFQSRTGIHYMTKEIRAVSEVDAVERLYSLMGGSHRARFNNIQIMNIAEVNADELKHHCPFADDKVAFPRIGRVHHVRKATYIASPVHVF